MRPPGPAVPGNRWDLVGDAEHRPPRVTVVVTHYEQPHALARTLTALADQTHPPHLLDVVVADDGSRTCPVVPDGVRLRRQRHDGFGAARARNLGAAGADGDVLVFLDADTTPDPGFVASITRLPALLPEAVVVGRRRHLDPDATERGALPEPDWLVDGYRRTRDLLDADETSFRYVISAVLACRRWLFELTGGFDETFREYGGEDWEWAHRAWTHGALLAHEPAAVAWHDEPDRGTRDARDRDATRARARLRGETVGVGRRIPVPGVAPSGFVSPGAGDPLVTVAPHVVDDALVVTLDSLLAASPLAASPRAVVLLDAARAAVVPTDPRVVVDAGAHLDSTAARSAWRRLHVAAAVRADRHGWTAGGELLAGPGAPGTVEVVTPDGHVVLRWSTLRAERRAERWADQALDPRTSVPADGVHVVGPDVTVQAAWGGWA